MRTRRHTEPTFGALKGTPWVRFARDLGLVALTFVVGYAASAYWITPGSITGGDEHAVPRVLGRSVDDARAAITQAGFRPRLETERPSAAVPRGGVMWQDPPPGTAVAPNTVVQLTPSSGPAAATVPDVIGLALPTAERVVQAAGIKVGRVDTLRGSGPEAGVVIGTRPGPGNGRPRGAAIDLVVSGLPAGGS